jgi:hypothetical protein
VAVRINSTLPLFNMFPLTSNAPSTVGPGTSVTWTADASSGTGQLTGLSRDRFPIDRIEAPTRHPVGPGPGPGPGPTAADSGDIFARTTRATANRSVQVEWG